MISHSTTNTLKFHLQILGALKPEAWLQIEQLKRSLQLKPNESYIRKEGCLAYVAQGILKEYDPSYRKRPAIINFIGTDQCFVTRKQNQHNYIKACTPTLLYYWDLEQLQTLYCEFIELKVIYDGLCAEYDAAIALRQLFLETAIEKKLVLFSSNFKQILIALKKKDIANYLHINYSHYVKMSNYIP